MYHPLPISLCMPLAYDYMMIEDSLEPWIGVVDEIILGVDVNRRTWTGQPFELDTHEVRRIIHKLTHENFRRYNPRPEGPRVHIIERDFYRGGDPQAYYDKTANIEWPRGCEALRENSGPPLWLDSLERDELSQEAKSGNCILMIDADEMAMNVHEFTAWFQKTYIKVRAERRPFVGWWVNLIKTFPDGQGLVVKPGQNDVIPLGSWKRGDYLFARRTGAEVFDNSGLRLLHRTLGGRTREQLVQKLQGWGHAGERDPAEYLKAWEALTMENYQDPGLWSPIGDGSGWRDLVPMKTEQLWGSKPQLVP